MAFNISWIAQFFFDIIAISEKRITKQVSLSNNLNLNNYSFEFTKSWVELKKSWDARIFFFFFFDIISEKRIRKSVYLSNNLNLNNHSFEFTPTKASAGGTLLYISNHLLYKCRNNLNIYKKNYWNYWNFQSKKIKYYCGSHLQTSIYGPYWL